MSLGTQIAWDDSVLPFQLDRADIRGRFVRLTRVLDEVLKQHNYPPSIEALVAEATLLTALIGQTLKLRWKLSLQVRGNGAIKLIATDYYGPSEEGEPARIRAYASFDADALTERATAFEQIGDGYFGILIDQGPDMAPYQGITPLDGGSLAACAETYFAQSEQIPTRFALTFGRDSSDAWRAGGIMIQHMPKASPFAVTQVDDEGGALLQASDLVFGDDEENWERVNILLDTSRADELAGPEVLPTDVLVRLFHEEAPRAFDSQPLIFGCTCSAERVQNSLAGYSQAELADLITEDGTITADCQFCGAHYAFQPTELGTA
ncbi:MAG: Hsp33 family molecular chaperone HslO [Pseudomonadota bacterium]